MSQMEQVIEGIKSHVSRFFRDYRFTYHSKAHTMGVYDSVTAIAMKMDLDDDQLAALQIAALFHDTGYDEDPATHEEISAAHAESYLRDSNIDPTFISKVRSLILATKMDVVPNSTLEGIIRDADTSHLGSKDFFAIAESLRTERQNLTGQDIPQEEWDQTNLDFVNQHSWNTKAAKKLYNKSKKENIALLLQRMKTAAKKRAAQRPEKGVETMYRVALRNHNQLSKIADNKANIMLSITAIMMSLILSNLATKIDTNPRLLIPTVIIVLVNLITMIFAILATRPKVSSAPYSRDAFLENKINILFFGNFYKMPLQEFEWGMNQLMENRELLYGSLSKDLYFLGSVLARKYRYLQCAYWVFMVGLIISVIAFVWVLAV